MKNKITTKNIWEVCSVIFGGLVFVAVIWFLYVGIYNVLESIFYSDDPQSFPADQLRFVAATSFLVIFILVFRKIKSKLLLATLSVAPLSTLYIMIILNFYSHYYQWISICFVIFGLMIAGIMKLKAQWYFYLSTAYSLLLALLYAWPR